MITESMLQDAAEKSCAAYVSGLEADYASESEHNFSAVFQRKMQKLIKRARHPVRYTVMRKIAAVILAALIGGGVWLAVDPQARAAFGMWIAEVSERVFIYRFKGSDTEMAEIPRYELSWIPEGYKKSRENDNGSVFYVAYKNDKGQLLRFHHLHNAETIAAFYDIDDCVIKEVKVRKYKADMFISEDAEYANGIVWVDENNDIFYIGAFLSEEDLIKAANSVCKK